MRQIALVAALLAVGGAAACACLDLSVGWKDLADRTPGGILVDWGSRAKDGDGICAAAVACPYGAAAKGARLVFAREPWLECLNPHAGACFDPEFDFTYLPTASVGFPGLCHELHHRALWLAGRDLDYGHAGPGWDDDDGSTKSTEQP